MTIRRLRLPAVFVLVAILVVVLLATAKGGPERGVYISHAGNPLIEGELVIQFRDNVPDAQRGQVLAAYGLTVAREMQQDGFVVVNVPAGERAQIAQQLATSDAVAVTEDIPMRYPAAAPDDPDYPQQWHLHAIHVSAAHNVTKGTGAIVAVVDTGVAFANGRKNGIDFSKAPDLDGTSFVEPYDAITDDSFPFDDYGHGTHIAGTIAQTTDNGLAAAGVAPDATIMPVKVCKSTGPGPKDYGCPTDRIADGIRWAVDHGAQIINISIAGGASITTPEREALSHAAENDVTVIAASGNGGPDAKGDAVLEYPAAVDSVISVGAVGAAGTRTPYSNYGFNEIGNLLDLVAPGGDQSSVAGGKQVLQQTYAGGCTNKLQSFTVFATMPCIGTSMASAHVSGVAALIRARFPQYFGEDIREILRCSADPIGTPPDFNHGYGLVRADRALEDVDQDGIPDCLDTDLSTPTPSPVPPLNACTAPTPAPTETPSPTQTPTPVPTGPDTPAPVTPTATPRITATPRPSETDSGGGIDTPTDSPTDSPTDTPVATDTSTLTETPVDTPTDTALPTETPTDIPTESPTDVPTETPTETPTVTPTELSTPTPTPTPRGIKCGDVDCSGIVNGVDALEVLQWMAQLPPEAQCIGKGYVNCDGMLNALDAATILRFSGNLPLNLPANCPGIE